MEEWCFSIKNRRASPNCDPHIDCGEVDNSGKPRTVVGKGKAEMLGENLGKVQPTWARPDELLPTITWLRRLTSPQPLSMVKSRPVRA
jgi:hypothetical protein